MDFKKILIISSIILILSLTAVSATDLKDVNATEAIAHDTPLISSIENTNVEKLNATTGTFDDLQVEINNAPTGSVLNLTRDYMGHYGSRIQFNKDLTIDGQGHTLDCLNEKGCSAFYSSAGTIILKNLKIINGHNDNTDKGGAVYIYGSGQYSLINCTLDSNWADDYGGAIYNDVNKPLSIINCTFTNNKVDDYSGGAIYSVGDVYISNTKFIKNSADVDGGAVYSKGNVITVHDLYESNQAKGATILRCFGGAIHSEKEVKINNSTFRKNYAENWGGAIYAIKVTLTGSPSIFDSNTAGSYGGAICTSTVTNDGNYVLFTNNKAENDNGGAIHANSYVNLENCSFIKNSALVDGGAIYSMGNVYVVNNYFESNEANGAIISSCYGGAIRAVEDVKIKNSTFKNNYAENSGGAVYGKTVTFEGGNSYFDHNTAGDYGGAIYAVKFTNDVSHVTFTNNKAEDHGGAVYIHHENWITFSHCVFANNKADKEGGAIFLLSEDSHLTLKENIFTGNTADEGEAVYNCGHYDSVTSNFWGSKNPSSTNDVLIEWEPFFVPNKHHSDSNPLKAVLEINPNYANKLALVSLNFYNSNGNFFNGELFDLKTVTFNITPDVDTKYIEPFLNCVYFKIIPEIGNIYNIATNLYGYSLTKTLDLTKVNIIAPEITTTYGVPAEFKIHIDGENIIKTQKITVTLDSTNYEVFTDGNGDASLYFNNYSMYPGTYDILIKINNISTHSAITILPNITIVAPKISSYYGSGKEFKIHLDGDKRFAANQKVKVSFYYGNYEIMTDENGDASIYLDTSSLAAGNYVISINVLNINAKSEYQLKTTIEGENIVRIYGDHTPFYATFRDSNGNYLPDCELFAYSIDNSAFSYMNVFGNEGKGSCAIAYLYPGYHFITLYNFVTREYQYYDINILPQTGADLEKEGIESTSQVLNQYIFNSDKIVSGITNQELNDANNDSIVNGSNQDMNAPTKNIDSGNMFSLLSALALTICLVMGTGCGIFIMKRKGF